jgi:hypothetical protein
MGVEYVASSFSSERELLCHVRELCSIGGLPAPLFVAAVVTSLCGHNLQCTNDNLVAFKANYVGMRLHLPVKHCSLLWLQPRSTLRPCCNTDRLLWSPLPTET